MLEKKKLVETINEEAHAFFFYFSQTHTTKHAGVVVTLYKFMNEFNHGFSQNPESVHHPIQHIN